MQHQRYRPFQPVQLNDRTWPSRTIMHAPRWVSVDLRDGNQALVEPMTVDRKRELFQLLVEVGFKEIEVGFPAASQMDFDFLRVLVDEKLVPDDVTVMVLTQARDHLIERTFEALSGLPRAIVHVYNSTSELQRRVVFMADRDAIADIAVQGVLHIKRLAAKTAAVITLQYSPESFTGTELDFALETCEAVMDAWGATPESPVILNLPATVEMSTPNVYADQIEWFARHIKRREAAILSVHPHNDRGTAVAAAELAQMAGADRVEGTLFGNGERTGNVDLVTLACNLFSQGVDPGLDFSDIKRVVAVAERCTKIAIHPRHPYAGELVFTAFSGSHQDAIRKGLAALRESDSVVWEVPYLPIDPADVGRAYEPVIQINSQSGKGGVAFVLEQDYGIALPRELQVELSERVQAVADVTGKVITPQEIWRIFQERVLDVGGPLLLRGHRFQQAAGGESVCNLTATIDDRGSERIIAGVGGGPVEAFVNALRSAYGLQITIHDYQERALQEGADAQAASVVRLSIAGGVETCGVGVHASILTATLQAVVGAVNRAQRHDGRVSSAA